MPKRVSSYLCDLQHLRVESVQVEHELGQADEGQLDGEHLPEGPVVGGIGERVQGPLLQHAAGHHVALHFFQDVAEHLVEPRGKRLGLITSTFWLKHSDHFVVM